MEAAIIFIIVVAIVIFWSLRATGGMSAQRSDQDPRACIGCGQIHPGYANYCRKCGMKLP